MSKYVQYDHEEDTQWKVILFDFERETKATRWEDIEITPKQASELARREGYGHFEIVQQTTTIKRFCVEGAETI